MQLTWLLCVSSLWSSNEAEPLTLSPGMQCSRARRALKFRQIDVAKTVLRDFQREGVPINPGVFALLVQVALR